MKELNNETIIVTSKKLTRDIRRLIRNAQKQHDENIKEWKTSPFYKLKAGLPIKVIGETIGEGIFKLMLNQLKIKYKKNPNNDLIIYEGNKEESTEIKFSTRGKKNKNGNFCILYNQCRLEENVDTFHFMNVFPENYIDIWKISKQEFEKYLESHPKEKIIPKSSKIKNEKFIQFKNFNDTWDSSVFHHKYRIIL
ncbi:MAG: hypothetical protein WC495_06690 [Patescibacteria group bacterium]|jgi:hypothetical protein